MSSTNTITDGLLPICSRAFAEFNPEDLIGFTGNVVTDVTGNAPLAAIKPPVATVQASLDDLVSKNQASKNRGRMEIMARKGSQKVMVRQMRQWASFVDSVADGDVSVVIGAGFEARRPPSTSTIPSVPANFRAALGKLTGEAVLRCKGGRNVRNFSVQYGESAAGPWIDRPLTTSARGTIVPGLTPGKMYWFRMQANGSAGSSDWTAPTCKMVM